MRDLLQVEEAFCPDAASGATTEQEIIDGLRRANSGNLQVGGAKGMGISPGAGEVLIGWRFLVKAVERAGTVLYPPHIAEPLHCRLFWTWFCRTRASHSRRSWCSGSWQRWYCLIPRITVPFCAGK